MSLTPIQAAIPHRDPFLLIDKIVEQEENRIVCQKELSGDEFWFRGHYPDFPLMPGVLLCESAMQAGAVLLSTYADGEGVPVATRLRDVRFKRMVRPGETITLEVSLDEKVSQAFFLTARVTVAKELAMRMQFTCTLAKISEPTPNPEKTA
ncbi:MAG: beta-hydroxyacyl-ACP dehydratase [Planctomycetaceae bacterium TMED10]|nr:MAG: beta-hydroxyacyl-ACP dehydratase [Planctomycetaceae bacterium TMED10]